MLYDKNYRQVNIKQNVRAKNKYKSPNYIVVKCNGLLDIKKIDF